MENIVIESRSELAPLPCAEAELASADWIRVERREWTSYDLSSLNSIKMSDPIH